MGVDIRILKVEKDGEDGLIVMFSDGTAAGYVVEELLELRPLREPVEQPLGLPKPAHPQPPLGAGPHPSQVLKGTFSRTRIKS